MFIFFYIQTYSLTFDPNTSLIRWSIYHRFTIGGDLGHVYFSSYNTHLGIVLKE